MAVLPAPVSETFPRPAVRQAPRACDETEISASLRARAVSTASQRVCTMHAHERTVSHRAARIAAQTRSRQRHGGRRRRDHRQRHLPRAVAHRKCSRQSDGCRAGMDSRRHRLVVRRTFDRRIGGDVSGSGRTLRLFARSLWTPSRVSVRLDVASDDADFVGGTKPDVLGISERLRADAGGDAACRSGDVDRRCRRCELSFR